MAGKSWVAASIFYLFLFQLVDSQAQKIQRDLSLTWKDNIIHNPENGRTLEFLNFEGAVYGREFPLLPCYYEPVKTDNFYSSYDVSAEDIRLEPLSAHDAGLIPPGFDQRELQVTAVSAYERGRPYALLSFTPIIKTGDGEYKRVKSLKISIEGHGITSRPKSGPHAAQSILASGKWCRFSVGKTGVYKVSCEDLQAMGMGVDMPSAHIALFGNGGGMLPEANSMPRIDDLRELPIQVFDGGDGVFNAGDYFIFYGESPHAWTFDTLRHCFSHTVHVYSDATCYFLTNTPGIGEKKRVRVADNGGLAATRQASTYTHYDFIEDELYNLGETGKLWLGDLFDVTTSRTYTFRLPAHHSGPARLSVAVAGLSPVPSSMEVRAGGLASSVPIPAAGGSSMATLASADFSFTPGAGDLPVTLAYSKPTASSSAYLDWIEIEVPCDLTLYSSQFPFCGPLTPQKGSVTEFVIGNASKPFRVWDVTDPGEMCQMALTSGNGTKSFKAQTDVLRKFFAFDGAEYLKITPIGAVENQNLHGTTGTADLIIVTHPDFKVQAERLAGFRRSNDGLSVKVATVQQVYNEFSGGVQDPMAIRDYMKMVYDRSGGQYPRYLLLMGRPSYDFRGRVQGTRLFVPNCQYSPRNGTVSEYEFFANDDDFGLLDDNEGGDAAGLYDLPVGRFPCSTPGQAKTAVDKSIRYTTRRDLAGDDAAVISNFDDWRNIVAFVADDEDLNDFVVNADRFASILGGSNPNLNFDKIYLDAFRQESNAGGQRYPKANTAINNRMNRGSLFFTYIGHSGKDGWAVERVLEASDINGWANLYNEPVMLTLSCKFGYYDRPAVSPAELILFNPHGGAAGVITATREAWSSPNNMYGQHFFSHFFDKDEDGRRPTVGELQMLSKNRCGGAVATLAMFVLMGDPSMPLAIPQYNIVTDSINHCHVGGGDGSADTLKALSLVTVHGRVTDAGNRTIDGFDGAVFPSVYDKAVKATTLANDPESLPFEFMTQKSILFRGNHSVKNGHFAFSFYMPKDIDYDFGNGKISYYARSRDADAAGAFTDFIIGGTGDGGLDDDEGPAIELYLNDENFVSGGLTDPDPMLIAKISDNYGINTTGNGIGHDLTATLDNAADAQIVLNDYYKTVRDSSNMGTVRYRLAGLKEGKHTLTVRAWDINNNHSEADLAFTVAAGGELTIDHVLNYPNPFTTHTGFYFEHNRPGSLFDIRVQIYTVTGKPVRTLNTTQYIEGNRSAAIPWDGRDDYGDKMARGTYLYRLTVKNEAGETAKKIEKMVIL